MTDRDVTAIHAACRRRSWEDSTDDASRLVLERAGDCITHLRKAVRDMRRRLVRQAAHLERAELANEQRENTK